MTHYSRWLFIAIALFVGAAAISVHFRHRSAAKPSISRNLEEDNLAELVFRHQIDESRRKDNCRLFFLSRGQSDPSDTFMQRFAGQGNSVKVVSQSVKAEAGMVRDKADNSQPGLILDVHRISWLSDSEAQVGISTFAWGW